MADHALLNTEDEVPGFLFGLASDLWLIVTGEAHELPGSGEERRVEVEGSDSQFAVFDAPVIALGLRGPGGGKMIQPLLGEGVEGGLVVFEGEVEVCPGGGDDQRRFFWALRASPVITALTRMGAACSRSCWLTGSSQSSFAPL